MTERVNFYDLKSNWSQFEHLLKNEEFIRAVNIFHWWSSKDEIGIDLPMIDTDIRIEDDMRGPLEEDEDIKFVVEKLSQNYSPNNPYWFTYPGECVELNNIVTYTLLKLMFPEKKFYSTIIYLNGERDFHNVIASKKIDSQTDFQFDSSLVDENEGLILYDLIYPLCFWFGKTFNTRDHVTFIRITPNYLTEEEWKEYNYTSYFEEHNIPFKSDYILRCLRKNNEVNQFQSNLFTGAELTYHQSESYSSPTQTELLVDLFGESHLNNNISNLNI